MTDIIIACAGDYGVEAYDLIRDINRTELENQREPKYRILGFLDDNVKDMSHVGIDVPVLGTVKEWKPSDTEKYVLGVATPAVKELVAKTLKDKGACFETLIAPTAIVDEGVTMGEGCMVKAFSGVCRGAMIGNYVNVCGSVGGRAEVGDYCTMGACANIANARVGKRVFVGSQSIILYNKTVGDDAVIGAGSVVIRNVKANTTVFGNPAKRL